VGSRWSGGRGLHTTRSIAQIFVGVVFNAMSRLNCMTLVVGLIACRLDFFMSAVRACWPVTPRLWCFDGYYVVIDVIGCARLTWLLVFWQSMTALVLLACQNVTRVGLDSVGVALGGGAQKPFSKSRWQARHLVRCCLSPMQLSGQYWCYDSFL